MTESPLTSLINYSQYIADLLNRPTVEHSTLAVWSDSPYTGVAEGEVFFKNGFRLRVREELDFSESIITSYGYEVYQGTERLYWYDDFPYPKDSNLASTYPHHKHVPPNIKHNRITAPEISFTQCNLPVLIREIEELTKI
ncbi:MAG: hypothetical protein GTO45_14235 [Candidatus Aminicenantes bacterium]|nr:hypothetical protein [Candidatus Aminicenantes bacterium]NIM79925.1 hypothetical protein [Candidatus Aminicenantes bacterium]NIN19264.1 hypothetical protein [Candidatus Aminicenantes bacterium]NIN43167.1 hypothetical protein [Candidatus Aminicenantes bacterium]NIN85906.1 hypothetical protein [Candidatus Aminicenantes bacterium]